MTSTPENLYITYVGIDRDLLKIWGQRNRIGATYIERQLLQLLPQFNRTLSPNPSQIHNGMFCFAKYTDDNYYRARVISRVQDDSVGVLFVDYGNRDIIKLSNIRMQQGSECEVLSKMSEQAEEYYLAGIAAPPTGWTKEIISKIRSDICYDEFLYQIISAVGDQKILKIQFHNEDYSNYLVKKQLASTLSLPDQRHMILTYCSLVSNGGKPEGAHSDMQRLSLSPSVPPNVRASVRPSHESNPEVMQLNYGKMNNVVNFSQPPPNLPYCSPRHMSAAFQQINSNIPKNSYPVNLHNQTPVDVNLSQPINPVLNPFISHQFNPLQMMKENTDPFNSNSNIIQILAQQVKQYIAEDNAKTESKAENIPHHYVNSVLKVGNTYNVIISYIDDGPWSFSIQLLSSETELQKLMDELSSTKLVPIKPPIILGHSCIASSALYGNLCRGVIVSISHSAVKVYFVDFGNTEDLPSSSIYEIPQKFFKIQVLSQKFSLSGLQKVAYSEDIKKFFKEVVQDELLMLRVTSLEDDNLPTCELYLKDKNIKRILNEKIRELRSSTEEDFPKVGDTENVAVTWVVSPQKFFVQLHKRDSDLKALKNELAEVSVKGRQLTYQQLSVGFKCVCQYESDGHWYRAVITSIDSENAITVFYVDYGNTETVKISLLRKMDSPLINQMSNQAIQCSLKGYENKPFEPELAKKLESLILEKDFLMSIVSSEKELLSVQLLENGQDISAVLIAPSPKLDLIETSSQKDNVWTSAMSTETSITSPFEKEKKLPEKSESCEKKDSRNFRGDKIRFEDKETWRNDKDRGNHWSGQKSDNQNPSKFRGSKQNRENVDKNIDTNCNFGGNRGPKINKGRDDRIESAKFEQIRGFKQDRCRDSWDGRKDKSNFGDKKKFEENRGGKERFEDRKFNAEEGKRLDRTRGWDSSRGNDSRRKFDRNNSPLCGNSKFKNSRKFIRKEDLAPPGSKFEQRILELGSCEKGIVTYYFSPHEFYVQLLAQEEEFKKMMKDIQTYYSDKDSLRDPVQAGDIIIAQFSLDKVLYRAEVIKPSPVTVRYVDYGNQEPVGPKGTWLVDKQFLKLPKQVIKCRLSNVLPVGSDWPPPGSAVDKFFESAEYKCTFLNLEGDTYEISMEVSESGKDIATEIIAAGLGRSAPFKLDVPEIDYSLLPNQVLRLYVTHVDSSSEFYVVINPEGLEVIENELKKFTEDKKNLIPLNEGSIKPEMPCLSSNDDISWHRGKIIKTDGNKILVWFSDRGERAEVTPDKLMSLPDYLKVLQPQAVHCTLYGVSNMEKEKDFKKEVEYKNHLVSIVSVTGNRLSVVLYNEDGEKFSCHKGDDFPLWIEPISQLPIISSKLPVLISNVKTPKEIYINRFADRDELTNFSELISNFYSEEKKGFDIEEREIVGELVAGKSAVRENWCRGRLTGISEEGLEVFLIDYGNREILPRENVKKLDPSFWSLNSFCRRLVLDVEYNSDKTEEITKFLELCLGKEVLAYFKRNGADLTFDFTFNGKKVSDLLKSADLVIEKEKPSQASRCKKAKEEFRNLENSDEIIHEGKTDPLKVFVRHIDSPKKFWVQKESTINDLHELQDKLQKSCKTLPDKKDVQMDDIVATLFCDTWYRAKVTHVEGDNVTVQFIDYGNTVIFDLNCSALKQLTDEFINVPPFATPFALKGTWNEDSTTKFEEIILQDEDPVSVVVLEESDPVIVDLFQKDLSITEMLGEEAVSYEKEEEEESDLCVVYITHSNSPYDFYIQRESCTDALNKLSERLSDASGFNDPPSVEENEMYVAKFPDDGAWYRARVSKREADEIQVHFVDFGNRSNVTEIKCLAGDLKAIPDLAENCCLLYGRNSDAWSEAACEKFADYADGRELKMRMLVSKVKKSVVELFHENKSITDELETLCESDGRSEVYVSHVLSPTDFYIQYVVDDDHKLISDKLEGCNECENLEEKLPGTLCQACFVDDGGWYRAKLLQNLDEGCEVFFIDYGNVAVSTELKCLPAELEEIPPRALRCSLNLPETNIPETVKEEFINLTAGGSSVFRARIIVPGDINIISLKLNGRILEETLNLDIIPEENGFAHENENFSDSVESETDDGKNSKKILISENYLNAASGDSARSGESVGNETDEEKRVKIASSGVDGFKSDDEKGIEGTLPSGYVNATDNELMEEALEEYEQGNASLGNTEDSRDDVLETVEEVSEETEAEESDDKVEAVEEQPTEKPKESEEAQENIKIIFQNGVSSLNSVSISNGLEKSHKTENVDIKVSNH